MKSLSVRLGIILIGLIIFGYTELWGADWTLFYSSEIGLDYYDAGEITRPSGNIVKVWLKRIYKKEAITDIVKHLGERFGRVNQEIYLLEINCAEKKQRFLYSASYPEKGEPIDAHSYEQNDKWDIIAPESNPVIESLFKIVCK